MLTKFKILSLLLLLNFFSCASYKPKNNFEEIIYNATTRGRSEKIIIKNNELQYQTNLSSNSIKLSEKQMDILVKEVSKINLNEINSLKAPTNKRLYDGAMHTTISLKNNSKEYISTTFDDSDPPYELVTLCNLLKSLAKR